jgi:biopolymer transport protein ExbD
MAKRESKLASKIPIDMTAMIDVVFQLLTFFMLTLKSVVVEGDFNIRMPLGASAAPADDVPIPPLVLKMTATPEGRLAGVQMGGKSIAGQDLLGELGGADAMLEAAGGDKTGLAQARKAKQQAAERLTATIQAQIVESFGNDLSRAELTELELDCDPGLKYDHVVSAITAASGIVQGTEVVPLIQKIKFAPPKKQK